MLNNETTYIPPEKEAKLLAGVRASVTLVEAEVAHLTEVKYGLQSDIASVQANLKSLEGDYARQEKTNLELNNRITKTQKDNNELEKIKQKLEADISALDADKKTREAGYRKQGEDIVKAQAKLDTDRIANDRVLSEIKEAQSNFEAKRLKAIEVLQGL